MLKKKTLSQQKTTVVFFFPCVEDATTRPRQKARKASLLNRTTTNSRRPRKDKKNLGLFLCSHHHRSSLLYLSPIMMWYHWLLILCLYGAMSWYSLHQSASPARKCPDNDDRHCVYPLVSPGDSLVMELWIYAPREEMMTKENATNTPESSGGVARRSSSSSSSSSPLYEWIPVDTCRFNVAIPTSGILPTEVTKWNGTDSSSSSFMASSNNPKSNYSTCTLLLPMSARRRSSSKARPTTQKASSPPPKPKPLQAVFRVKKYLVDEDGDNYLDEKNGIVLGDIPFEITRILEKKEGFFWSSTGTSIPVTKSRNLLDEPLAPTSSTVNNRNNNNNDTNSNNNNNENRDPQQSPNKGGPEWVPYLKYGRSASVNIRIVAEYRPYGESLLLRQDGARLSPWNKTMYRPMIYIDDKSVQHGAQIELASPPDSIGKPPIQLRVKVSALSPMMDSLNRQMIQALEMGESFLPGPELDEIRYFLQDERLYRFALTQIISYVHMWLDYMAFRDEISFYRGRQTLAGVSTSTVITRFLCSFIILLYLLDGGGTSWVVLLSLCSSCAVEAWKVWRLIRPRFHRHFPFVTVRHLQTTIEQDTATYDRIAVANLTMILYPLVIGWSLYALRHYTYKSWYSWLVSNLANAVYTFGFISLCPQLYVNYRLKSVAHLPWKVFMYKIFNTFVDDAFAWLIEMPWKHRIMTLRDDVVFLMLLVQVYIYRVDKSRTNEFGYSYEQEEKERCGGPDKHQKLLQQQQQDENTMVKKIDHEGKVTEKMNKLD